MKYLIRQAIEELHENDRCPRLMIDATVEGVVVPAHVREEWAEAMPIDLDPIYPLELSMDEAGVDCVLSFHGPFQCHFPWSAIYVVQDRESQLGIVVEEHVPTRLRLARVQSVEALDEAPDALTAEPATPPHAAPRPQLAPAARIAVGDAGDDAMIAADGSESAGPERRRASFKVIDGGKS